jgi:hypothetical protein
MLLARISIKQVEPPPMRFPLSIGIALWLVGACPVSAATADAVKKTTLAPVGPIEAIYVL